MAFVKTLHVFITIIYMIVQNLLCAQMSFFNRNKWINIYIEPDYQSPRFYQCMKYPHSKKCILFLQRNNEYIYTATGVKQVIGEIEETNFNYECTFMYDTHSNWLNELYWVECAKPILNTCFLSECRGWFKIQWRYIGEYYSETSLRACSTDFCSVYEEQLFTTRSTSTTTSSTSTTVSYVENNTIVSISSILNTTKYSVTTTPGQYVESTDYSVSTLLNVTLNSDPGNTLNTNLIIIIVFVVISFIICTVIVILCLRKRSIFKKESNASVTYANDSSNMDISNDIMFSTYSICTTYSSISTENCKQIYDEYTTAIPCTDSYSTIESLKTTNIDSVDIADINTISEKPNGLYQNINSATGASLTKPYARLGENIKVFHHHYKCLLHEQKENQRDKDDFLLKSDLAPITAKDTDTALTKPYARLGEHIKVFEHDYNYLVKKEEDNKGNIRDAPSVLTQISREESTSEYFVHYSTTSESSNPYSLAKSLY